MMDKSKKTLRDKMMEEHDKALENVFSNLDLGPTFEPYFSWRDNILDAILEASQTKDFSILQNALVKKTPNNGAKENLEPNTNEPLPKRATRTRAKGIKQEKLSLAQIAEKEVVIKTESEEMPAPKFPASRKRAVKKTIKKEKIEERFSDVVMCETSIPTVDLLNTSVEQPETRVTRTKTRKMKETQEKRERKSSSNDESDDKQKRKRSKSDVTTTTEATFHDAVSEIPKDTTFIASAVNTTVVLEKPTVLPTQNQQNLDEMMTDDDSGEPAQFNMCSPSPVKQRIQQFETLSKKPQTPSHQSFIPKAASTTLKKPSSASKNNSLVKYDERREEALKKREAMRQAEIEEKRRKREERELKVQQQKAAIEKEKKKHLEEQLNKEEERRRLAAAEMKEKKAETEKKKQMKIMEIADKKRRELDQAKNAELPVYMTTKAPFLPTPDCYDSDEEDANATRTVKKLTWGRRDVLEKTLEIMKPIKHQVINSFFVRQTTTPDLIDVFEKIEPKKLKRTSSAIWLKPPRYTMISNLEDFEEK